MNEEEKKSVNELKEEINKPVEVQGDKFNTFILYNIESAKTVLNLIEKLQKENEKYKQFFDLMLRLDSDYFMNCGDEETIKLVDEILKLESE